ncbi:MAG: YedE family putative selenium transporter [Spirochaetes bacterium]|nr:YedE family putative selenium transporter [Spirochaetota bacterium]
MKNIFASKWGIVISGIFIAIVAIALQINGNPPNMGICVACFERDIAGALGLHRVSTVQYVRPEIIGFILGAFLAALVAREFKPRGGSSPVVRFFLGVFSMIGALVFLGCPWRAFLRLAGGDFNAILGLCGLAVGIFVGVICLKNGYSLGRSNTMKGISGLVFPFTMGGIFVLSILKLSASSEHALFFSATGPGSMHANLWLSFGAGIAVGAIAQRSRFCTMGAFRDAMLVKDFHLMSGVLALLMTATILNIALGKFNLGFENQPIAHSNHFWNFAGMVLAGFAFTLAGGCPGRQLFLAGEGDGDAAVFVIGMIVGAGLAHNFATASSSAGVGAFGPLAVVVGLIFCGVVGIFMREKMSK